jgi:DNA topoisomerase-1
VGEARAWIEGEMGRAFLASSPRSWAGGQQKGAQEAHEAIRPTDVTIHPSEAARYLDRDQAALYELIWLRFVAGQMAPAVYDTTTVDFDLAGRSGRHYLYRATGSVVKFQGFTRLYLEATEAGEHRRLDDLEPLPALERGDVARLENLEPRQHFTQPPARFSEASLVKELESLGIGRPSTYAQIISTLLDRGYVELEQRRFEPTELGEIVAKLLIRVFPNVFDVAFTSRMEDELDRIEEGQVGWRDVLGSFYPRLRERLEQGGRVSDEIVKEILAAEGEVCEKCGSPMMVKFNKLGRFLGCSAYPECKNTRSMDPDAADQSLGADPDTGRAVSVKVGPYGPYVELAPGNGDDKPRRVSLPDDVGPEGVDLSMALRYLSLPRELGEDPETGEAVSAGLGRYGPYVRRGKAFANLPAPERMFTVTLDEALALIGDKERSGGHRVLKELGAHPESQKPVRLLDGRYGPYVSDGKVNATVPRTVDSDQVDLDTAVDLLARKAARKGGGRGGQRGGGGGRRGGGRGGGARGGRRKG